MSSIKIFTFLFFFSFTVFAADKKAAADSNAVNFNEPQVLEVGDQMIGARTGLGNIMGGGPGFGFNYERQITPMMSVGGQLFLSNYSVSFPGTGSYSYTSTLLIGYGAFHADLAKVKNLDTYGTLGLAYNSLKGSWSSGTGFPDPGTSSGSAISFIVTLNARYFFNSKWAVSGALGNVGTILLGIDYML
jgi:hypothetical protein